MGKRLTNKPVIAALGATASALLETVARLVLVALVLVALVVRLVLLAVERASPHVT